MLLDGLLLGTLLSDGCSVFVAVGFVVFPAMVGVSDGRDVIVGSFVGVGMDEISLLGVSEGILLGLLLGLLDTDGLVLGTLLTVGASVFGLFGAFARTTIEAAIMSTDIEYEYLVSTL